MKDLRLSLLGGFAVELAGTPPCIIELDKTRLLLAYLAIQGEKPVRRERLAGLFWPESSESHARHSLSQALSSLHKAFQAAAASFPLEITPQEVRFRKENAWLDVHEFEALLRQAEAHNHPSSWPCRPCLELLEAAADLYRGDFLAGFSMPGCPAIEEWRLIQQEAFHREMLRVVERLVAGFEAIGELDKALAFASQQVGLNPLDEAAHRQVMRLLACQGRRQEALAQYAVCQKILAEELGIEPEPETVALYRQILENTDAGIYPAARHNLPAPLTPLVGRQAELERVCLKLAAADCRLVTILGAGGAGKSRLALEAGYYLLRAFRDGIFWVELNTQVTQQSLALLIAQVVGLEMPLGFSGPGSLGAGDAQARLFGFLREKNLLLILDGFEGLLSQASLISSLLSWAPQVKVLATSRARLNLDAEYIFLLEGLSYPDFAQEFITGDLRRYGAAQLFLAVAQRSAPGFDLSESNQPEVAEICRLVHGVPLGILLAAAWVDTLTLQQIISGIRRNLDFLSADWRGWPDRQRSLRATFDYSWALLPNAEKSLFLRLSVFHAPFTVQRAAQVADAAPHQLKGLIGQSLLQHDSTGRFRLHDLLRQYAHEKLASSSAEHHAVYERHCQVFLQALADWEPRLKNHQQPAALAEMDLEYADLIVAWEWAVAHKHIDLLERTGDAFHRYHLLRGRHSELRDVYQKSIQTLAKPEISAVTLRLWLRLSIELTRALILLGEYGNVDLLIQQIERTLQEWGELASRFQREIATLCQVKGIALLSLGGDYLQALAFFRQGLELMMDIEEPWDISSALYYVAVGCDQTGYVRETGKFANQALAIQKELGDPALLAGIHTNLGYHAMLTGDCQASLRFAQEQVENRRHLRDPGNQANADGVLGLAIFYTGEYEQARAILEQAIQLYVLPGQQTARRFSQYIVTSIYLHTGQYADVLNYSAFAELAPNDICFKLLDLFRAHVHLLDVIPGITPSASMEAEYKQAEQELYNYLSAVKAQPRLDMIGQPLALLGYIAYRRGKMDEAVQYLKDALENGLNQGFFWVFMLALSVLALILAEAGELEEAVEVYATATAHPCAANSRWWEDMFGKRLTALTASLPAETLAAAQDRGRARSLAEASQQYLDWLRASPILMQNCSK